MDKSSNCLFLSKALEEFQSRIADNPQIGPSHISLFIAILHAAASQGFTSPISVFSRDLMKGAKIYGVATYHKCMQELKELGFIEYVPSYNPLLGSLVYLQMQRSE